MRFSIVTLFPEFFDSCLSTGLMDKARRSGLVEFSFVNPRDFAEDKHRSVDDRPYGGGPGMVMMPGPLSKALRSVPEMGKGLVMSPDGRPFDQAMAGELAGEGCLTLVCGRYEGIDARVEELFDLAPVSVGDFVLNGGEAAAQCLIEAVARLVPGFMGKEDSGREESFSSGLLEYPHYTRPEEFEGLRVPGFLLSGDHARVDAVRREKALELTLARRPDLLAEARLETKDLAHLRGVERPRLGRNLYLCLVHYPVLNKFGETGAVSLTNLDIHDMSRVSRSYGLGGLVAVTPLEDQRDLLRSLVEHWTRGPAGKSNPDRAEAMGLVSGAGSLDQALAMIEAASGERPVVVATSARPQGSVSPGRVRDMLLSRPVALVLGTGSGLADHVVDAADHVMRPLRFLDAYNHLSVRSAASVLVDRVLGDTF